MAFEKGQSGNPGGRVKERPFRDALRKELADIGHDDPKALRGLARNLLKIAASEDGLPAIKEIADRLDGKVPQSIENSEEGAFEIIHRIERAIVNAQDTDSSDLPAASRSSTL